MPQDNRRPLATVTRRRPSFLGGMARALDLGATLHEPVRVRVAIKNIDIERAQRDNLTRAWAGAFQCLADASAQVLMQSGSRSRAEMSDVKWTP